ncbi:MAG: HAMP domain-containing histidine kinase [Actinomycetia bacterium]|nr:HAMP domain-containing histidine kinase [Actinomycetes bacterium]
MTAGTPASTSISEQARLSLRGRVSLLAAAAVAIAVAVTTLGIYLTVRAQLYDQLDSDLLARAEAVSRAAPNPDVFVLIPADALGDARIGLVTADRRAIAAQGGALPPLGEPEFAVAAGKSPESVRSVTEDGQRYRVASVPAGTGVALVYAATTENVDDTLAYIGFVSLIVGLLGVAVAASAGYLVARTGLAPLRSLTAATERVATTMDLTPIETGRNDEIGRLASSFNTMLDSLAAARERERQLVADAGHELRTPLTSLRTNLDLLAQEGASERSIPAEDRAALLADVRGQIGELGDLVDDLVQLSRGVEASSEWEPLDLAVVVDSALARVQRRARDLTFEIALSAWWVSGDAPALSRAVTNLLDNAVKWSPPGSTVIVQLHNGILSVADSGPGIDLVDRPHIFDRFYRADGARSQPGSGLGLAIVAQAIAQHRGSISVLDSPTGGARFDVAIPGHASTSLAESGHAESGHAE